MTSESKKIRVPDLALMKARRERIAMLTCYDATMARLLDQAGVDLLLVGDSLGHVILGLDYLPARMLNEFVYCPRLFYYEWVEGVFAHNRETVEKRQQCFSLQIDQALVPARNERDCNSS